MARRLPSLNALKAFEAAARHESFTDAAAELFVTHAAISRHIRDLEEWLGTDLFTRTGRGVELTEPGRHYGARLTPLFDPWPTPRAKPPPWARSATLKVSVEPAFASRWLVPRLGQFNDLHPDIELDDRPDQPARRISTPTRPTSASAMAPAGWDDVEAQKLTDVVIFPVCAPKLLEGATRLKPAELGRLQPAPRKPQAMVDRLAHRSWRQGVEWTGAAPSSRTTSPSRPPKPARALPLGDQILCTDSLVDGWLVRPFAIDMKDHGSYWMVRARRARRNRPRPAPSATG